MTLLRKTGNTFEVDATFDPRDIIDLSRDVPIGLSPFIGLPEGGFARLRIDRETGQQDRIVIDRWAESGERTLDDRFVTQAPVDRTIVDAGLVPLRDGGLGAVWVHSNNTTGSDTLLYKELKVDGTLGPATVLASVTTVAGSQYAWQAVPLGSGRIMLGGTLALNSDPADYRVVTMVIEPDGSIVQPFTQLLSTSGAFDRSAGLVPLSDGGAALVTITDTRRSDLDPDQDKVEYGSIFERVTRAHTFDANGQVNAQFDVQRGIVPGDDSFFFFSVPVASFQNGRFGVVTDETAFRPTLFDNDGKPLSGVVDLTSVNLEAFDGSGGQTLNRVIRAYDKDDNDWDFYSLYPGLGGTDVDFGLRKFSFVGSTGTSTIEYLSTSGQSFGAEPLPGFAIAVSGQSIVFYDAFNQSAPLQQYKINGLVVTPGALPEDAEGGFVVGQVRGAGIRADSIASLALGGPDAGLFTLTADRQLVVNSGTELDFETDPEANLVFTVRSTSGSTIEVPVDLTIQDRNEEPNGLTLSRQRFTFDPIVNSEFVNGQVLATLVGKDPDRNDILTYELLDNANGFFGLAGDQLVVANGLALSLLPEPTTFTITARVKDQGGLFFDRSLKLDFVKEDKPVAFNDSYLFKNEQPIRPVTIAVLENDLSPAADIDRSTLTIIAPPSEGTARVENGTIIYTPAAGGWKKTELTYTFRDIDNNLADPATVTIKPRSLLPEPFVASIDLVDDPDKGYSEATGTFTLGRSDGIADLLYITGTLRAYGDRIEVRDAVVYSFIARDSLILSPPLFRGSFVLDAASASGNVIDTGAKDGLDKTRSDDVTLAGVELAISRLRLLPTEIQLGGSASLPTGLGGGAIPIPQLGSLSITTSGPALGIGTITIPDQTGMTIPFFKNLEVGLSTKGVGLTYVAETDTLRLQGTLTAKDNLYASLLKPDLKAEPLSGGIENYGAEQIVLNLGNINDLTNKNFLQFRDDPVTGLQVTGKGSLSLSAVKLGGGFEIKNIELSYGQTEAATTIGGKISLGLPMFGGIAKAPVFIAGELEMVLDPVLEVNKVGAGFSDLLIPVPQVPGMFLDKASLTASNLSRNAAVNPGQAPFTLEGTLGFVYGLHAGTVGVPKFTIPQWLNIKDSSGDPVTELSDLSSFEITGKMQVDPKTGELAIGGSAKFTLLSDKFFSATLASAPRNPLDPSSVDAPLVNFSSGAILARGSFNLGDFFSGQGRLKGDLSSARSQDPGDLSGSANVPFMAASGTGILKVPNSQYFGRLAGQEFAQSEFYVHVDADRTFADDSFGVMAKVSIAPGTVERSGFQIFGDGTFRTLSAKDSLPMVGSWEVSQALPYITMSVEWENGSPGSAPVVVTYRETKSGPILATYTEADFAANGIAVVAQLTGDFGKTVVVDNPRAGVWDIELVNASALGAVRETGHAPQAQLTFNWSNVQIEAAGAAKGLRIALDVGRASDDALVDIYIDGDTEGFDGVLAAGGLTIAQARAGFFWNRADADSSLAHLYAIVRDSNLGPVNSGYHSRPVDLNSPAPDGDGTPGSGTQTPGTVGDIVLFGTPGGDWHRGSSGDDTLVGEGVLPTPEALSIRRLYLSLFQREPDDAGWSYWTEAMARGMSLGVIADVFLSSPEFLGPAAGSDPAGLVKYLFRTTLARDPDAASLSKWAAELQAGKSRGEIAAFLSESPEALVLSDRVDQGALVFRVYDALLGRFPDQVGFDYWTDQIVSRDSTLRDVVSAFMGSSEHQSKSANLSNEQFIATLYQKILKRDADPASLAYWSSALEDQLDRVDVITQFLGSQELQQRPQADFWSYMRSAAGGDTIHGGGGDDRLSGGRGADSFMFRFSEPGSDTVFGYEPIDTLVFEGFGFTSVEDALKRMRQDGDDIIFIENSHSIRVIGASLQDITVIV